MQEGKVGVEEEGEGNKGVFGLLQEEGERKKSKE